MKNDTYSVEAIRKYLLGQLPESESDRLDELSIADDECADLIRAVEFDLIDAFVGGELHGAGLEYIRTVLLATPRGQEATRFAEALRSLPQQPEQTALQEQ